MYVYSYRIYDVFHRPPVRLAVLSPVRTLLFSLLFHRQGVEMEVINSMDR